MTNPMPIDDQIESALMNEFSHDDSFEFTERMMTSITKATLLRHLTLLSGWLIGLMSFFLTYPIIERVIEPWLLQIPTGTHQTLFMHLALCCLSLMILAFFSLGPLYLSNRRKLF